MSTLANTTWKFNCTGEATTTVTVAFKAGGIGTITFPNGTSEVVNWAEAPDGHFMYQWPHSTSNPNVNQAFFGLQEGAEGAGHWCDIDSSLNNFTMEKQ